MEEDALSREQSVSLLELFYDLIYVYAISQVTGIFHDTEYGLDTLVDYAVASFVVLQAWMYMTNYINRFGRTRRTNAALVINMCAAVVMAVTIGGDWVQNLPLINGSLFIMLGSVAAMYASHWHDGPSERQMALYSLKTLVPACVVYLVVGLAGSHLNPMVGLVLDIAAILWGVFGPALIAPKYTLDLSLISFPHLVERFELITIITFGEAVVTVAEVFKLAGVGMWSILTFMDVVSMFGCYVVLLHDLTDHTRQHRGLRLIYLHFLVVSAINLFTVSLNLLAEGGWARPRVCVLAAVAMALYYLCLASLSYYHRDDVVFSGLEKGVLACSVAAGISISLLGIVGGISVFLAGPLVAASGCFLVLRRKDLQLMAQ